MLENEVAEPAIAMPAIAMPAIAEPKVVQKVVQKVVPSEEWLKKHRERMACARPVVNEGENVKSGDAKQERGKPPESQSGKKVKEEAKGQEGRSLGQGQALGLGDGKMQGLGDGWGW